MRLLLDTHVLIRWFSDSARLSKRQRQAITSSRARRDPLAFSAFSVLEIAILEGAGRIRLESSLDQFFADLAQDPMFVLLPLTYEIASEAGALASLRDPADRTIVATARVHRMTLLTSDQRILDARLVPTIA